MEEDIQEIMNMVRDMKETARNDGNMATWTPGKDAGDLKVGNMVSMNICTSKVSAIMKNAAAGMNSTVDAMVAIR
ncbi:hypothetical protein [Ferroplasma sp.]|uniref:hypothetical protein n=1 Tax=Ferroplasma sp. TaxID=2591003 RepID=UPI00261BC011|nr:hypothetical protein [Ferroplasma sp.]MCL4453218.1 hypothetical protein [Candidatus Thermoplasmatota archaeon]